MTQVASTLDLNEIPVLDVGADFPLATLKAHPARAHALIDSATRLAPGTALKALDHVSRRWLARWNSAYLEEIDEIAAELKRPGAYFLSVNYEWGCTCRVGPAPDSKSARMIRVLDWRTPGLGRNIIAARVAGRTGPFVTLTWPGYTGVLQANAKGRFCAALNQAPMRRPVGLYAIDWAANKARVWGMGHPTPAHLLRDVFETAPNYADARAMLIERPIATPAIYVLAGIAPSDTVVIERSETSARVHDGDGTAANHWRSPDWPGKARGIDSTGRARRLANVKTEMDPQFPWLKAPVLNRCTRLVMMADASTGAVLAQGYERTGPATKPLVI